MNHVHGAITRQDLSPARPQFCTQSTAMAFFKTG